MGMRLIVGLLVVCWGLPYATGAAFGQDPSYPRMPPLRSQAETLCRQTPSAVLKFQHFPPAYEQYPCARLSVWAPQMYPEVPKQAAPLSEERKAEIRMRGFNTPP